MKIQDNQLIIGDVKATELVSKYGSPIYVYDEGLIRQKFRELKENIPYRKLRIYYACKANTNPHIMKVLFEEGSYADVLSPGEIVLAKKAGFSEERMMFTSTSVTDSDMKYAIDHNIMVNCDSLSQLERYGKLNPNCKVSIRINPDVGGGHHGHVITGGPESKFGIYFDKVDEAKSIAKKHGLKIVGIHQHIGSGILDADKFKLALDVILKVAKDFHDLEFVDLGGGFGIPYRPEQKPLDMKAVGKLLTDEFEKFCKSYGRELLLFIEPGRYPVAEAGFLLCTVNTTKQTPTHKFAGVDTGFNHLIRPAMYGSYHPIIVANNVEGKKEPVVICGNVCESGDAFTRDEHGIEDRELPAVKEGDIIAILNAGAYGFAMASNYNSRFKPVEVLVKGTESRIIRKQETWDYLMYGY